MLGELYGMETFQVTQRRGISNAGREVLYLKTKRRLDHPYMKQLLLSRISVMDAVTYRVYARRAALATKN